MDRISLQRPSCGSWSGLRRGHRIAGGDHPTHPYILPGIRLPTDMIPGKSPLQKTRGKEKEGESFTSGQDLSQWLFVVPVQHNLRDVEISLTVFVGAKVHLTVRSLPHENLFNFPARDEGNQIDSMCDELILPHLDCILNCKELGKRTRDMRRAGLRGGHLVARLIGTPRGFARDENAIEPDKLKNLYDARRCIDNCELVSGQMRLSVE